MKSVFSPKFLPLTLLLVFLLGIALPADAQGPRRGGVALRVKSKKVIRRTAVTLFAAQKELKQHKIYTGNFARAVAHQRFARSLWRRGMFIRAIHHSRRARMLAKSVIIANKGAVKAEMDMGTDELPTKKDGSDKMPPDEELDKDLEKEMPGYSKNDEEFVDIVLDDIDLSDLE